MAQKMKGGKHENPYAKKAEAAAAHLKDGDKKAPALDRMKRLRMLRARKKKR